MEKPVRIRQQKVIRIQLMMTTYRQEINRMVQNSLKQITNTGKEL